MIRNVISWRDVFGAGLAIGAAAGSAKLVWAQPMLPGGCACPRSRCRLAASLQASRNVRPPAGKFYSCSSACAKSMAAAKPTFGVSPQRPTIWERNGIS